MKFKKIIASILSIVSIISAMYMPVFASSFDNQISEPPLSQAIAFLDSSNDDIGIAIFIDNSIVRPMDYKSTSKTSSGRFYLKSTDETLGNFKCIGYFSYDGTLCNVTDVKASTSNGADGYRMEYDTSKNQISPTYACATGEFRLYKVGVFGSENLESTAVINIFCNQKGTTFAEFNGD